MSRALRGARWRPSLRARRRLFRAATGASLLVSLLLLLASAVHALTAAELQSRAGAIAAERRAGLTARAEQQLIERLGQLVLGFIDLSDRAARAGNERGEGLRPAFEAIHDPLDGIYSNRNRLLESKARAVMEADGDLEALYETPEWKESQVIAAQSLYYLNWLNYYGARQFEGERRKQLLEAAERGFSEFAVGERGEDLIAESLLGRGLCHLDLGNHDWAVRDFRMVLEEPKTSADRKQKARLALLDAYVRGAKRSEALKYSQELLADAALDPGDLNIVRFYRLQVLLDVTKTASAADAERHRREAATVMDQLRRAGKGWSDRIDALMVARIDDPAQWAGKAQSPAAKWQLANLLLQKGNEKQAADLLEEIVASKDPAAAEHRAPASYLLGVTRFKAGDFPAALTHLEAALSEPGGEHRADASYMRFKTLEALMARETSPELAQRYAAALRDLLQNHPGHPLAHEARYRLGEYLQAQNDFEAAIAEYAQVRGDPGFELRARFATVQCDFEILQQGGVRSDLLERIGSDLARFNEAAEEYGKRKERGDVPLEQFLAKATVLQAVHASLREPSDADETLRILAGFEQRFPGDHELLPQAVRLRLAALQRLERFADAEKEVTTHAEVLRNEGRTEAIEKLAAGYVKSGARRKARGDAAAAAAAERVALRLYELLGSGTDSSEQRKLTLARLYQSTGDGARAEALYKEILQQSSASLPALRGLAQLAEEHGRLDEASSYWKRYTEAGRAGDPPWYDGHYQQARLILARGDKKGACTMLNDLRPAMPGLGDAELRRQLNDLYKRACD